MLGLVWPGSHNLRTSILEHSPLFDDGDAANNETDDSVDDDDLVMVMMMAMMAKFY